MMNKLHDGDIYYVEFPYQNEYNSKRRPSLAIILGDKDSFKMMMITSIKDNKKPRYYDVEIKRWREAGLSKPSYARVDQIRNANEVKIYNRLGKMSKIDMVSIHKMFLRVEKEFINSPENFANWCYIHNIRYEDISHQKIRSIDKVKKDGRITSIDLSLIIRDICIKKNIDYRMGFCSIELEELKRLFMFCMFKRKDRIAVIYYDGELYDTVFDSEYKTYTDATYLYAKKYIKDLYYEDYPESELNNVYLFGPKRESIIDMNRFGYPEDLLNELFDTNKYDDINQFRDPKYGITITEDNNFTLEEEVMLEMNNSFSTEMPIVISDNDVYCNMDKIKDTGIIFVCGISGSGKTTLAKKIADTVNGDIVSLDVIDGYTRKERTPEFYQNLEEDEYIWKFFKDTGRDINSMVGMKHKQREPIVLEYIEWLENNHEKVLIIEGCQVAYIIAQNPKYEEYPIIFKGTSKWKSFIRSVVRKEHGRSIDSIEAILKYYRQYNQWEVDMNYARRRVITKDNHYELSESGAATIAGALAPCDDGMNSLSSGNNVYIVNYTAKNDFTDEDDMDGYGITDSIKPDKIYVKKKKDYKLETVDFDTFMDGREVSVYKYIGPEENKKKAIKMIRKNNGFPLYESFYQILTGVVEETYDQIEYDRKNFEKVNYSKLYLESTIHSSSILEEGMNLLGNKNISFNSMSDEDKRIESIIRDKYNNNSVCLKEDINGYFLWYGKNRRTKSIPMNLLKEAFDII